jgi:hypothetical protein
MSDASFEEKYVKHSNGDDKARHGFSARQTRNGDEPAIQNHHMAVGAFLLAFALFKGR